jgi:GTP-dependent phosphoenolpyruvate carboxykinase
MVSRDGVERRRPGRNPDRRRHLRPASGGHGATSGPGEDLAARVFLGATLSSETTAAATEAVGVVRRDPMAMLPFLGYAASDYVAHRLQLGAQHREGVPAIFYVNRFRASPARDFLWPGFGENSQYSSGTSRANAEEWQAELAFDRGLFRHVGPEAPRRAPYRARRPG